MFAILPMYMVILCNNREEYKFNTWKNKRMRFLLPKTHIHIIRTALRCPMPDWVTLEKYSLFKAENFGCVWQSAHENGLTLQVRGQDISTQGPSSGSTGREASRYVNGFIVTSNKKSTQSRCHKSLCCVWRLFPDSVSNCVDLRHLFHIIHQYPSPSEN